jgi:hypothetical protein
MISFLQVFQPECCARLLQFRVRAVCRPFYPTVDKQKNKSCAFISMFKSNL